VGLRAFVGEIVDILAVLPLRHALVVVASSVLLSYPVRIADEERANPLLNAEVKYLSCGFMAQIAHSTLDTACHLVFCALQFLPPFGILLTASLLFGELPVAHIALALKAADAAS
jgi:hypothetical protein